MLVSGSMPIRSFTAPFKRCLHPKYRFPWSVLRRDQAGIESAPVRHQLRDKVERRTGADHQDVLKCAHQDFHINRLAYEEREL
jgi:hypothetical protein